jgi:hypothetical protein
VRQAGEGNLAGLFLTLRIRTIPARIASGSRLMRGIVKLREISATRSQFPLAI